MLVPEGAGCRCMHPRLIFKEWIKPHPPQHPRRIEHIETRHDIARCMPHPAPRTRRRFPGRDDRFPQRPASDSIRARQNRYNKDRWDPAGRRNRHRVVEVRSRTAVAARVTRRSALPLRRATVRPSHQGTWRRSPPARDGPAERRGNTMRTRNSNSSRKSSDSIERAIWVARSRNRSTSASTLVKAPSDS